MSDVTCGISRLNGTPVFIMQAIGPELKRVFGATFFKKQGVCMFPAYPPFCADVVRDLKLVVPDIKFTQAAVEHIVSCNSQEASPPDIPGGFKFYTKPYEHQREGLAFAMRYPRCGLFYDMGLGKTKIVVDLLRWCSNFSERALILAPTVGIGTWIREVKTHATGQLKVVALTGDGEAGKHAAKLATARRNELRKELGNAQTDEERHCVQKQLDDTLGPGKAAKIADIAAASTADVVVVSYDTAKLYEKEIFDALPYSIIVADESHNLRGPTTDRTKAALALASKAHRRLILSGTPSLGNPLHLYGQLAFLAPYIPAKDQWTFRKHYLIYAKGERKMLLGFKNLETLHDKVARVSIRKTKEECLDLPPRTIVDVYFDPSTEQRNMYNDIVSGALVELEDGSLYDPNHAAVALQKLLQVLSGFIIKPQPAVCDDCENLLVCAPAKIKPFTKACAHFPDAPEREIQRLKSNPKLDGLGELLDSILAEDRNKVIVWCYFIEELELVQELLEKQGVKFIRVDGSNSRKGQTFAEEFNSDPTIRVWLAQVGTGVALTLTAASYMIYFGLTFKLDDYLQSMERNYRIGQTAPTFVYRMLAKHSVMEFVVQALEAKLNLAEALTARIDCMLCNKSHECLPAGRKPFEDGCIYPSRMNRKVIRPGKL